MEDLGSEQDKIQFQLMKELKQQFEESGLPFDEFLVENADAITAALVPYL